MPLKLAAPAPWFEARTAANPRFAFSSVAGRPVVLCFFGSTRSDGVAQLLHGVLASGEFDDERACFFGVTTDPDDEKLGRVRDRIPGVRFFFDDAGALTRLYGADQQPLTVVLDERLRVAALLPLGDPPAQHLQRVLTAVRSLGAPAPPQPAGPTAPVLVIPRVFEPQLCADLMRYFDERGGQASGFMREQDGKTVLVHGAQHKLRKDEVIEDEALRRACMIRIHDRLAPEVAKAFQFRATRIERYIVSCYDADTGGYFRPHRDNTTKGTAHRRFAVSLLLNTGEYEGGWLRFPEYGRQLYTAPAGGAVVFSCSLLHEATPVTKGKRYAFLPFLYDDAAAKIREENLRFVQLEAKAD